MRKTGIVFLVLGGLLGIGPLLRMVIGQSEQGSSNIAEQGGADLVIVLAGLLAVVGLLLLAVSRNQDPPATSS